MSIKAKLKNQGRKLKYTLKRLKRLRSFKKAYGSRLELDPETALERILKVTEDRPLFEREQKILPLNQDGPDLSVVIPFYNSKEKLVRCIRSVLDQNTEFSMEIIAVNDGSTDHTLELVQKEIQDPRLKIITQPNHGAAYARNTGVMNAAGKYVWCIDSDDVAEKHFVQRTMETARKLDADVVKCGYTIEFSDGRKTEKILPALTVADGFDPYVNAQDGFIWNMIVRRSLYDGIGMPEGWWFEDMTNRLWLLRRARVFSYLPESHYLYTINEGSLSSVQSNSHSYRALEQILILRKIKDYSRKLKLEENEYEYLLMIKEMGITLYNRIRYMDESLKQAAFILACELSDSYREKGLNSNLPNSYYRSLDQVLKNRQYEKWNALCAG